jgi:hypothetical protein
MKGMVSYQDFKRVFQTSDDDMESHGTSGGVGTASFETIAPRIIPELVDTGKVNYKYEYFLCYKHTNILFF